MTFEQQILDALNNIPTYITSLFVNCEVKNNNFFIYEGVSNLLKELNISSFDIEKINTKIDDNMSYSVYYFFNCNGEKVYIKFIGNNCSYNGYTCCDILLVEARQVTVTQYIEK